MTENVPVAKELQRLSRAVEKLTEELHAMRGELQQVAADANMTRGRVDGLSLLVREAAGVVILKEQP